MFYGIGVGVGNSDNVTKMAIDVISSLDVLYVPKAKKESELSVAFKIIKEYVSDKTIVKSRHFPMSYDTEELKNAWDEIALDIEKDCAGDKKVGFITIGDPMVYSTYIYLLKRLKTKVKVQTIPGITSFLDIASKNNFPMVEGDNPLVILPATMGIDLLRPYIKNEQSLVLMKVYNNFDEIIKMLVEENLQEHTLVVSNSSKDEELLYKDLKNIQKSDVSYFTTILINKGWEL